MRKFINFQISYLRYHGLADYNLSKERLKRLRLRFLRAAPFIASLSCSTLAAAQSSATSALIAEQVVQVKDVNRIDFYCRSLSNVHPTLSIVRHGNGGVVHSHGVGSSIYMDDNPAIIKSLGAGFIVNLGNVSRQFTLSSGRYSQVTGAGASLSQSGASFTFTSPNGDIAVFSGGYANSPTGPNRVVYQYFYGTGC